MQSGIATRGDLGPILGLPSEHDMPDRAMELRHLAQADRHIREGERREHVVQGSIDRSVALNMNADHARVLLLLFGDGIASVKAHG